jgi:hypothetical protein
MGVVFTFGEPMSDVTDVILTLSLIEESGEDCSLPAVERVNECLVLKNHGKLERVEGHAGGRKAFQAVVLLGAFNYLDIDDLVNAIAAQRWEAPEDVQLFIKREHDDTFTLRKIPEKPL